MAAHLGLSAEDWRRLQAVNQRWNDDIVANRKVVLQIYSPLAARADKSGVRVERDIHYASDPRQVLDIFVPENARQAPVVVFVHGGAFTRGAKSIDGEIYDNFLYWFAKRGCVGVNVEYRLAPDAKFPGGAKDVALAVEWIEHNISRYGGDRSRIVLIGHSAGGAHVASYLTDHAVGIAVSRSVAAAVLISARLRLECRADNPNAKNVAAYCGDDPAMLDRMSAVSHAGHLRYPVLVAFAEFENRHLDTYALEYAHTLSSRHGKAPRVIQVPGHNHTSIVAHFNTGEETLGCEILSFIESVAARDPSDSTAVAEASV
jgi:acetyl esterase/lipase